jgi:uncharacterized protein (DUF2252 family)
MDSPSESGRRTVPGTRSVPTTVFYQSPGGGGSRSGAQPAENVRTQAEQGPASAEERQAQGKAARADVPRRSHGEWEPAPERPDPIDLLEQQAATRVPELVPIRYGRMSVSPFAFYRGAALVMASDLAPTPRSGLQVQLCGDAHLSNFGVFGTPERRLVFDVNDFDETSHGPWEWDVKRLVASIAIAGRERGFTDRQRAASVLATASQYRSAMRAFAAMRRLDVWYAHLDAEAVVEQARRRGLLNRTVAKRTEAGLAKARTHDSLQALSKLTRIVDGEPRIISDPPLLVPVEELAAGIDPETIIAWLRSLIADYRETLSPDRRRLLDEYRLVQFARKVVGVGSVGTRAWIGLLLGRDHDDPLFLQMKEAGESVLEPFAGPSEYENHGQRVVIGQRMMQSATDMFLGWRRVDALEGPRDFYVRQLRDWKGGADVEQILPEGMSMYGRLCGWTLARAHARSGDPIAIGAYLGAGDVFDQAMVRFAEAYADQNERDYRALLDAIASGRIAAETGV